MPQLIGYGPHVVSANDDYDLLAAQGDEGRDTDVTVGLEFLNGYNGTVTPKTRPQGTSDSFAGAGYTKADETVASAGIAAGTNIRMKMTGKELRLTTTLRTAGELRITVRKSNEG